VDFYAHLKAPDCRKGRREEEAKREKVLGRALWDGKKENSLKIKLGHVQARALYKKKKVV